MPGTALISSSALMLLTTVPTSVLFVPEPCSSDQQLTLSPRCKRDQTRHKEAKRLAKDICSSQGCSQVLVSSSSTNLCNSPRTSPRALFKHFGHTGLLPPIVYKLPISKDFKGWHHSDGTINTEPVLCTPRAPVSTTFPPVFPYHRMNI